MPLPICYRILTYEAREWFTLTFIKTLTPSFFFTIITIGTNHFICEIL